MATESSSVFVAVRVRPFTAKEDAACCTVTVPDNTTITVFDLPSLIPSSTAGGPPAGGATSSHVAHDNGMTSSVAGGAGAVSGGGSGSSPSGGKSVNFNIPGAIDTLRHSYSFDKIFWSVAPTVLPFPPLAILESLGAEDSGIGGTSKNMTLPTVAWPNKVQRRLFAQYPAIAKHLPCFAPAPIHDDQQRVYEFIGPRMYQAVMSGFNACILAYGQTGSGKSYSMIGPNEALASVATGCAPGGGRMKHSVPPTPRDSVITLPVTEQGIMPRLCADLFRLMREERDKDEGITYSVELSFLEIYCERVRDLLAVASSGPNITYHNPTTSAATGPSLRIRQHPSQGPYVEGLSHVRVRDAEGVLKYLLEGLRDRATAETNMNEHSSRSHAILQLHITKVMAEAEEGNAAVVTRTRTCKVNMVDLAGSERVSQSGVSGDRFEEAKNINLSLSTLGRVIQQLTERQAGKNVIPAYRDSVLTWLLSDSLGGNSKTIMLATVAPSAFCYQQTLNTLRFAGVAKKVVNVASVNEDRHFQELIAELRRQIVRLTLQLESGKAAEVHLEKIESLKREREALQTENDALKIKVASAADTSVLQALRKHIKDLEDENTQLREEKQTMQERILSTAGALRDELANQRAEVMHLHETLARRETEVTDWANRYRKLVISTTSPSIIAASGTTAAATAGKGSPKIPPGSADGSPKARETAQAPPKWQEELNQTRSKLQKALQDIKSTEQARQEAIDAATSATTRLDDYRVRYEENRRQLDLLHERMQSTMSLLETTQCELNAVKAHSNSESAKTRAVEDALDATSTANASAAAQIDQMRMGYLEEKQRNVQLLLRLAQVEQERSALKRTLAERATDMCELEQLLLEETETSERGYMRMRFYRTAHELQHHLMVQLQHQREMEGRGLVMRGRRFSSVSMFTGTPSLALTPRPVDLGSVGNSLEADSRSFHRELSAFTAGSTHEAATTVQLTRVQRMFECQCEESQLRAVVEQECAADVARLLLRQVRLRQMTATALSQKLIDAEDALRSLREELRYYKEKVKTQEVEYADEVAQHTSDVDALQLAEGERLRLERKVLALEEVNAELEMGRNSLIFKVAQLQEQQSALQERCAEAERIAAEVQDLLLPGLSSTTTSSPLAKLADGEDDEGHRTQQLLRRSDYTALQLEANTLTSKMREADDALKAKALLEQQCEEFQAEVGALRALVEQMKSEKQEALVQLSRDDQVHRHSESRISEANAQLLQEIATITRDYESRIKQQQTMMSTLRHALDEETSMADMCRQSAQRSQAARQAQEEELNAARESLEELRRQRETTTRKYTEVQSELDDIRARYHVLERRLLELREKEPELYVLLEKGLGESTSDWLEKVRGEKLRLLKQRKEAQMLNSELLQHVRDHHTRLRDVQRQLTSVALYDEEGVAASADTEKSQSSEKPDTQLNSPGLQTDTGSPTSSS